MTSGIIALICQSQGRVGQRGTELPQIQVGGEVAKHSNRTEDVRREGCVGLFDVSHTRNAIEKEVLLSMPDTGLQFGCIVCCSDQRAVVTREGRFCI